MLSINKIQSYGNFGYRPVACTNKTKADRLSSYQEMNKPVYNDFVDGDISLLDLLLDKFDAAWNVLTQKNPNLEIKAQMIEQDLLDKSHNLTRYGMVV